MRTRAIQLCCFMTSAFVLVAATGCEVVWTCKTPTLVEITNSETGEPVAEAQASFFALTPTQEVDDNLRSLLADSKLWSGVVTDTQGRALLPLEVGFFGPPPPWNPNYGTCSDAPYLADRVLVRAGSAAEWVEVRVQPGATASSAGYTIHVVEVGE